MHPAFRVQCHSVGHPLEVTPGRYRPLRDTPHGVTAPGNATAHSSSNATAQTPFTTLATWTVEQIRCPRLMRGLSGNPITPPHQRWNTARRASRLLPPSVHPELVEGRQSRPLRHGTQSFPPPSGQRRCGRSIGCDDEECQSGPMGGCRGWDRISLGQSSRPPSQRAKYVSSGHEKGADCSAP
jgi:hypothetical protein